MLVFPTAPCRRHAILLTPHKRNEVERSVGERACARGILRVGGTPQFRKKTIFAN